MEEEPQRLEVVYSPTALEDLEAIGDWNAEKYSPDHAVQYRRFLMQQIELLSVSPLAGAQIDQDPAYRFIAMRMRPKRDGHVAVYRVDEKAHQVRVLHIFHTKQDWRRRTSR